MMMIYLYHRSNEHRFDMQQLRYEMQLKNFQVKSLQFIWPVTFLIILLILVIFLDILQSQI